MAEDGAGSGFGSLDRESAAFERLDDCPMDSRREARIAQTLVRLTPLVRRSLIASPINL